MCERTDIGECEFFEIDTKNKITLTKIRFIAFNLSVIDEDTKNSNFYKNR